MCTVHALSNRVVLSPHCVPCTVCAIGVPRPGHSVLGQGTFTAARPAFEDLASAYVAHSVTNPDSEVAMFRAAGAEVMGINWMQATDPDALKDCVGCTAHLRFPGPAA